MFSLLNALVSPCEHSAGGLASARVHMLPLRLDAAADWDGVDGASDGGDPAPGQTSSYMRPCSACGQRAPARGAADAPGSSPSLHSPPPTCIPSRVRASAPRDAQNSRVTTHCFFARLFFSALPVDARVLATVFSSSIACRLLTHDFPCRTCC